MKEIKIAVQGNKAALLGNVDLVAGTIGLTCKFYFDDSWKDLNKTISYKVGSNILATKEIKDNTTIVPPNVLIAGLPLEIGVTGKSSDSSIVIPTSWSLIGRVQGGAANYPGGGSGGGGNDDPSETHIVYDGGVIV